jgi:site-specific recombinase XerD
MSDKLILKDGDSVDLGSIIDALEASPDREELLEALKGLRQDKVKSALGATVKAAQFDREQVFEEFLRDGEKSIATVTTYRREVARLFKWMDRQGVHVLQLDRSAVNRFRDYLKTRFAVNTVRVCLAACSSFFSYLEAESIIESSPFARIAYPKRQYRKALRPDQSRPEPVMSTEELQEIISELQRRSEREGKRAADTAARASANRLLRVVHALSTYGLRVSSLLSLEVHDGYISYGIKGGEVRQKELLPESAEYFDRKKPFAAMRKSSIQGAIHAVTKALHEQGRIRYAYSAHDFRHHFAVKLYEATGDVYQVMQALNHSSVATTQTYLAGLGFSVAT